MRSMTNARIVRTGAGCSENGQVLSVTRLGFDLRIRACLSNPERPVKTYPTRVENGEVQISLEVQPPEIAKIANGDLDFL